MRKKADLTVALLPQVAQCGFVPEVTETEPEVQGNRESCVLRMMVHDSTCHMNV